MNKLPAILILVIIIAAACNHQNTDNNNENSLKALTVSEYHNNEGRDDIMSGGIKMIPIQTPSGEFKVWTKRIGNNPTIKVLILHGGPGASHLYLQAFDSFFPQEGIEYYYYDQLESGNSNRPNDTSLWHLGRFVEEVEQVRVSLGLNKDNFYLYGQSWGGILAIDYALKYQENMKALIISNMVSSIPDYVKYAKEVLGPQLDPEVLNEIKDMEANNEYLSQEYAELVAKHYYPKHILRMPLEEWPEPVVRDFDQTNVALYTAMQGPSEFGVVGDARLKNWDRNNDLNKIKVPTLTIGAEYDTMDPEHMKWMATQFQNGSYLYCPKGSHLAMYDDQETYFEGLIQFIEDVDRDKLKN